MVFINFPLYFFSTTSSVHLVFTLFKPPSAESEASRMGGGSSSADVSRKISVVLKLRQQQNIVYLPRWQPNKKSHRKLGQQEENFNQHSEILKWRDLQKGIYKVHGYKEKQKQFRCLSHITIEHKRQCKRI